MTSPLLRAVGARIAVDGTTVVPALDLETRGDRVVLAGDAAPLVQVLLGPAAAATGPAGSGDGARAMVEAGVLELAGRDVTGTDDRAWIGLAPLDPPLPPGWTVAEYLGWAGRLTGLARRAARDAASLALERTGLGAASRRPLRSLSPGERRAVVLAQALVGEPEVLICEAPLSGLAPGHVELVARVLERASAERRSVVSVERLALPAPEAELVRGATDVCVLRAGGLLLHAEPSALCAGATMAEVSVLRRGSQLSAALGALGAVVRGGPRHFAVSLPAGMTLDELLAAAVRVDAPVVRCVPWWV